MSWQLEGNPLMDTFTSRMSAMGPECCGCFWARSILWSPTKRSSSQAMVLLRTSLLFGSTQPWASLVAQPVKIPPAVQETWVRSLGLEDPLEKGMATPSRILAWRIPWTEEPGAVHGVAKSWTGLKWLSTHTENNQGQGAQAHRSHSSGPRSSRELRRGPAATALLWLDAEQERKQESRAAKAASSAMSPVEDRFITSVLECFLKNSPDKKNCVKSPSQKPKNWQDEIHLIIQIY